MFRLLRFGKAAVAHGLRLGLRRVPPPSPLTEIKLQMKEMLAQSKETTKRIEKLESKTVPVEFTVTGGDGVSIKLSSPSETTLSWLENRYLFLGLTGIAFAAKVIYMVVDTADKAQKIHDWNEDKGLNEWVKKKVNEVIDEREKEKKP